MQIEQHWVIPQTVPYSVQRNWKQQVLRRNNRTWKMANWDFASILALERKWKTQGWMPYNVLTLITFVKGRLNFSCKSTTAADVDLTESLLDNWLNNNPITVDKIYYLRSLFVFFFTNFSFQIYFLTAGNRHKNKILWQLAKIRLEWISQSNGSIGRPLGFVIDRLNTSASLYRIAPCLSAVYEVLGVLWLYDCINCGDWINTIKTDVYVAGSWFLVQFGGRCDSYIIYIGLFQCNGG